MPDVHAAILHRLASDLLCTVGTEPAVAKIVADSLIDANLAGHDSHGVLRLPAYLAGAKQGHVVPARSQAAVTVRGHGDRRCGRWLGPACDVVGDEGHDRPGARARPRRRRRPSQLSHRSRRAVRRVDRPEGMIGQAMANAAPAVAPFGGRSRVMGTNPMAWAVPRAATRHPSASTSPRQELPRASCGWPEREDFRCPRETSSIVKDGRQRNQATSTLAGRLAIRWAQGSGFSLLAQFIGRGLAQMDPSDYDGPRRKWSIHPGHRHRPLHRPGAVPAEVEAQCAAVTGSLPAEGWKPCSFPVNRSSRCVQSRARRSANPRFDLARPGSAGEEHRVALPADSVAAC